VYKRHLSTESVSSIITSSPPETVERPKGCQRTSGTRL